MFAKSLVVAAAALRSNHFTVNMPEYALRASNRHLIITSHYDVIHSNMCFLYLIQGLNETVMTKIITSGCILMAVLGEHRFSRSVLFSLNVIFSFLSFFKQLQALFNILPRHKDFFFQQAH